jgi:hypothetical protein
MIQDKNLTMVEVATILTESFANTFNENKTEEATPILVTHLLPTIRFKGVKDFFSDFFEDTFAIAKSAKSTTIRCFEEIEDHYASISIAFNGEVKDTFEKISKGNSFDDFNKKHFDRFTELHGKLSISLLESNVTEIKFQLKFPMGLITF